MKLPFDEALAVAKRIGAEYVWFAELPGETVIAEMSDAEVERMGERVARHGLKLFQILRGKSLSLHSSHGSAAQLDTGPPGIS